jgi:hypothetical protein
MHRDHREEVTAVYKVTLTAADIRRAFNVPGVFTGLPKVEHDPHHLETLELTWTHTRKEVLVSQTEVPESRPKE